MFLKKLAMVAITVVLSLALATSAGVWARQDATLPANDSPIAQRPVQKPTVERESDNLSRSADPDRAELDAPLHQMIDRIELLRLDVELLNGETQARMSGIQNLNGELIEVGLRDKTDANDAQIESIKTRLRDARNEYLSKKKELNQKQAELGELNKREKMQINEHDQRGAELRATRGTSIDKRAATRKKQVLIEPAASDAPGISPILEKRLLGIEEKLDNVLKTLEDLKRQRRQ